MVKYWKTVDKLNALKKKYELWNLLRLTSYSHHSKVNTKGTLQTYNIDDGIVRATNHKKNQKISKFLDRHDNPKVRRTVYRAPKTNLANGT